LEWERGARFSRGSGGFGNSLLINVKCCGSSVYQSGKDGKKGRQGAGTQTERLGTAKPSLNPDKGGITETNERYYGRSKPLREIEAEVNRAQKKPPKSISGFSRKWCLLVTSTGIGYNGYSGYGGYFTCIG
jgi:hypothetical protein